MISRWFILKRGRAISIANTGNGLAKASMPLLAVWLFALVGWRNTWMVFGLLTLAMVVLPAFLVVRRSPEDMGLQPDGGLAPHQPSPGKPSEQPVFQAPAADVTWTRGEAVRTGTFWLLVVTYGTVTFGIIGLNLHIYPYITDIGYSPGIAATVMGVMSLTQMAGNLIWGVGRRAHRRAQGSRRPVPVAGVRPGAGPGALGTGLRLPWVSSSTDSAWAGSW